MAAAACGIRRMEDASKHRWMVISFYRLWVQVTAAATNVGLEGEFWRLPLRHLMRFYEVLMRIKGLIIAEMRFGRFRCMGCSC
jgi:hypothetical protein